MTCFHKYPYGGGADIRGRGAGLITSQRSLSLREKQEEASDSADRNQTTRCETGSENHRSGLEKTKMIPNKENNPGMLLLSCFLGDRTPSYVFVQNETRWIF